MKSITKEQKKYWKKIESFHGVLTAAQVAEKLYYVIKYHGGVAHIKYELGAKSLWTEVNKNQNVICLSFTFNKNDTFFIDIIHTPAKGYPDNVFITNNWTNSTFNPQSPREISKSIACIVGACKAGTAKVDIP